MIKSKKIISLIIALIAILLLLTSCFPSGQKEIDNDSDTKGQSDSDDSNTSVGDLPSEVNKKINDNFLIDAKVNFNKELTYYKSISIDLTKFDMEKAKSFFAPNKTITESHFYMSTFDPNYETSSFTYDDRGLSFDVGSIYFSMDLIDDLGYSGEIEGYEYFLRKDLGEIYNKPSLESLDKDEAISTFTEALTELKIPVNKEDILIYALDYETMISRWEDHELPDESPAEPWKKEDEAYALTLPMFIDGVPITTEGYANINAFSVHGSRIKAIVRKEGIVSLSVFGMYDITEKAKETIEIIDIDSAINRVASKYKDIIIENPVTVHKISLEYLPVRENEKYFLKPAWIFELSEKAVFQGPKGESEAINYFSVFVSAETGEEVVSGGKA